MALTYTSYVSQLTNLMSVASSTDPNFSTFLPGAIDYSEGRIYRDLDLLATRLVSTAVSCSSGVRTVTLSTAAGTFLVVERVSVLTSTSAGSSIATRNPTVFVAPDWLDSVYPTAVSSYCGLPLYVSRLTDDTLAFGPAPDAGYGLEIAATYRPSPLSSGNSSTWLTQNVPELFMAATMVFGAGFQQNFGAQGDNPQQSVSWEQQYQTLLNSANLDELRKKYRAEGWSPAKPSQIATPPRV
jgi:hypothetical protein